MYVFQDRQQFKDTDKLFSWCIKWDIIFYLYVSLTWNVTSLEDESLFLST